MQKFIRELKEKMEQLDIESVSHTKAVQTAMKALDNKADSIANLRIEIAELKEKIEPLVLAEFKKTKKKKTYGGVGIQEKNVLTYDEKKALAWAINKQLCLVLDKKPFEKLAVTQDIDFVTSEKKPKVTYPKVINIPENDLTMRIVSHGYGIGTTPFVEPLKIDSNGSGAVGTTPLDNPLEIVGTQEEEDATLTINIDGDLAPPGTTSPSSLLHVRGNDEQEFTLENNGSGAVGVTPPIRVLDIKTDDEA